MTIIPQGEGLVKKLAAIRREVRNIEKRGENTHFHYKYMRAEDVAGDIGDKLAEANIVLSRQKGTTQVFPMSEGRGFFVVVECEYVFVDGDTGETMSVWSCGGGSDSQDKGPYKAQTGALKYALTQALCMRVGDDPEDEGSAEPPVARTGAIPEAADANDYASAQDLAMLRDLVVEHGFDVPSAAAWIQRQCKELWGMTTTSDGKGGARLKDRLQNRHVQELTRRIVEDKDPGEEF